MSAIDSTEDNITIEISFPYFKQGDDFSSCDGNLEQFISLHQAVIKHCQDILDMIPLNMRDQVKGDGNTHFCTLSGPRTIMERLIKNDLGRLIDYDD